VSIIESIVEVVKASIDRYIIAMQCNSIFLELWTDFQSAQFLQEINHGMILTVRAPGPPQHGTTVPCSFGVEVGTVFNQQFNSVQVPSASGLW